MNFRLSVLCVVFCLVQYVHVYAQVSESFEDADFTQNPAWSGDDSLFIINTSNQLQSNARVAGQISLSTPHVLSPITEWTCWIRQAFSPSTQNFSRFYLVSDTADLKGPVNGYYLQYGGITGNNDSIMLFKQSGVSRTLIIGGRRGTVAKTNNLIRVKVTRDTVGVWAVYSDTTGGAAYLLEGFNRDTQYQISRYAGFYFQFTVSNRLGFFADDIRMGPPVIDTMAPRLTHIEWITNQSLRLQFNEPLDTQQAKHITRYSLDKGIGNPQHIVVEQPSVLLLTFSTPFVSPNVYNLQIDSVSDTAGNMLTHTDTSFLYFVPQAFDVLVSEFFPDPSPPIGLPELEFVELYNNTNYPVSMLGWTISDGSGSSVIPSFTLQPDSFIILCPVSAQPVWSTYGTALGVPSFPSLNNTSDSLIIRNASAKVIHSLYYDQSWYKDDTKRSGGWSIELSNPLTICSPFQVYQASAHPSGGTPGRINSVWNPQVDTIAPKLIQALTPDDLHITCIFSEQIDTQNLAVIQASLNPDLAIDRVSLGETMQSISIRLINPLTPNQDYSLRISGVSDCSGNAMAIDSIDIRWFVPDTAHQFDIVITEIMSDPDPQVNLPNVEYIELYNRSLKTLSLQNFTLLDKSGSAQLPAYILQPDSFVVLASTSGAALLANRISNIIGVSGFPSLGNDEDDIVLLDNKGKLIHYLAYTSAWHSNGVKQNGGWSLEMKDHTNPCAGAINWASSINSNGGTPGFTNSITAVVRDTELPELLYAHLLTANQLRLTFSETIDTTKALQVDQYRISGIQPPVSIHSIPYRNKQLILTYPNAFDSLTLYRISVSDIADCSGNIIGDRDYADFQIPVMPSMGSIVINELLFDPKADGSDFVELYNTSEQALDLRWLMLAKADDAGLPEDAVSLAPDGYTLLPGDYVVLASDIAHVISTYYTPDKHKCLIVELPSYPNTEGICMLTDASGQVYDKLAYADDMHFPLIDNPDGVSLERINPFVASDLKSNWTSASKTSGYATPTYQNSQFISETSSTEVLFIVPEVFSPDNDGYHDIVGFQYQITSSGFVGNLRIYNSNGLLVKELMQNDVLGNQGTVYWDGIQSDGSKAPIGIYTAYFEYHNLQGKTERVRKAFVLAAKL